MDWFLPGVPPTNKVVDIDLVVVVQFRGDKLACERIYWDQATVLRQVGLLKE
jgi:carboxymethylenebutenolidase